MGRVVTAQFKGARASPLWHEMPTLCVVKGRDKGSDRNF